MVSGRPAERSHGTLPGTLQRRPTVAERPKGVLLVVLSIKQTINIGKRPTGLPAPPRTVMGHTKFYTSLDKDPAGQLVRREGYLSEVPGSIPINVGLGPGGTRLLGT